MKLYALEYGKTELAESMIFAGGAKEKKQPISLLFFLLETENKKILIDVGCDTMPGFPLFAFQKPVEVLEAFGVPRNEIDEIILTHSHHDHIDAVHYYENATVHIQKEAFEQGESYLKDNRTELFAGEKEIAKGVLVRHVGGHGKGSSVVLISFGEKQIVLCGDECYSKENLTLNLVTGSSVDLEKSRAFLTEYRKPSYIPVLFHDPDLVGEIGVKLLFESKNS